MSELLESLASSMPSALHAGVKLRDYVKGIDEFLAQPQRLEAPNTPACKQQLGTQSQDSHSLAFPTGVLQRIPWPGEWFCYQQNTMES